MSVLIVVQARLGSTRLPGKVLMPLGGKPVLQHVVERCQRTGYPVVVACPASDTDRLAHASLGCVMGHITPVEDVLTRYVETSKAWPTDILVRITADCPLVDPRLIHAAVQAVEAGSPYAGNTVERHWPRGLDVEAFTTELLLRAHTEATIPHDREHVTPWMQRNSIQYALPASVLPLGAPKSWRWCLDTPTDYQWLSGLFKANSDPSLEWVAEYSRENPPPED